MDRQEFTKYISKNFKCSKEAADAVITLFGESVYLAMSEGHSLELDNLGRFKTCIIPRRKTFSYKKGKMVVYKERRQAYFAPGRDLKVACNY